MFYAHQLVLEVGSETGIIGLVGLLGFFVVFIRSGRNITHSPLASAAWFGAFEWLFPINTHTALYSAYSKPMLTGKAPGRLCCVQLHRDVLQPEAPAQFHQWAVAGRLRTAVFERLAGATQGPPPAAGGGSETGTIGFILPFAIKVRPFVLDPGSSNDSQGSDGNAVS